MVPKRTVRNRRARTLRPRFTNTNRPFADKQMTCRASGCELPYDVREVKGSDGMLHNFTLSPADSAQHYTIINPSFIGVRCLQMAQLYNEWRLNRLVIRYRPIGTRAVTTTYSLSGTGIIDTQLAGGFVRDPTVGNLAQSEIVECGGKFFRADTPFQWTMGSSKWLYCVAEGNSVADVRFVSPGNFFLTQFTVAASDPTASIGYLEFDWDISFRYPLDAGATLASRYITDPLSSFVSMRENNLDLVKRMKEDKEEEKAVPSLPSAPVSVKSKANWF